MHFRAKAVIDTAGKRLADLVEIQAVQSILEKRIGNGPDPAMVANQLKGFCW